MDCRVFDAAIFTLPGIRRKSLMDLFVAMYPEGTAGGRSCVQNIGKAPGSQDYSELRNDFAQTKCAYFEITERNYEKIKILLTQKYEGYLYFELEIL